MKIFKKAVSVILAVIICLAVFPGTMKIKSSAVKYAYTGNKETGITGTHHWPGNCLGGTSVKALGANEVSTDLYTYNTDHTGVSGKADVREMSNDDAPVATYYVDANDSEYTATLLCEMTADTYARIINLQVTASDDTKSKCSISDLGWDTQWYFKKDNKVNGTSKYLEFTGKTPSSAGQQVEYMLYFLTDIQNSQSGYIDAVYKLKIRFVAFGGSDSGKATVTNHILRNWTDLYCYDAVMSAYNVDGGTNGEYINNSDGEYAAGESDFLLKSTATAYAYIDRTAYSNLEDTGISFSHKVSSLCANGTNGWSWAGIRVSSDIGSFSSSIGRIDYTIDNSKGLSYLTDVYNLPFKICGSLPNAGETVNITVSGYYNANATKTGYHYNAYTNLVLTLYLYDKTELNTKLLEAKGYLNSEQQYSSVSFASFKNAYNSALDIADSQRVTQAEIETAIANLTNAINALERVQTVTLDSQSATTAGTTSVVATIGKAMPAITLPTREHYSFGGYFTQPNGEGIKYYNTDGSSARDFDLERNITLYADWTADKFNVKFVNYDGTILDQQNIAYGETPTYNGATPTKPSDDSYEYTFSNWSPKITAVTGDTTYTAQFDAKGHEYKCVMIDGKQHQYVCIDCGYKKAPEKHKLVYVKTDNGYSYTCSECGYSYTTTAKAYSVEFSCNSYSAATNAYIKSECEKFAAANPPVYNEAKSKNYYIAAIKAPLTITENGQKLYFAYWKDADTNEVVGTYTTYRYFQTKDCKFTPVYETQQNYYTTRDQAVIASRVVDFRPNDDGSYSLLAEHSVASSCKSIKGHGVIYTTDSSAIDSLVYGSDNENVTIKAATTSNSALTGLFEVIVKPQGASKIWVRTYVIDANNVVHYGATVVESNGNFNNGVTMSFDVTANTASAGEEVITLGSAGYDLTDINTESDITFDEEKPTEKSPLEIFKTIIEKLVSIINEIISYFTKAGARI